MGQGALKKLAGVLAVVGVAAVGAQWALLPRHTVGPCTLIAGPLSLPDLPETSGLALGMRDPSLLWSQNDSGHEADIFAIDATGALRGRVRVPVAARDWEDISAGMCDAGSCLYIADIGDNRLTLPSVRIHRVPEPSPDDRETATPVTFTATYDDGAHNAEAMFLVGRQAYIVTRDREGALYRATLGDAGDVVFRRVGALGLGAVTDAETSRDGQTVAVRTSHEVVLYRTTDLTEGRTTPRQRIPINALHEAQGEGVALDGTTLYLSSEGRMWNRPGRLLSLQCALEHE